MLEFTAKATQYETQSRAALIEAWGEEVITTLEENELGLRHFDPSLANYSPQIAHDTLLQKAIGIAPQCLDIKVGEDPCYILVSVELGLLRPREIDIIILTTKALTTVEIKKSSSTNPNSVRNKLRSMEQQMYQQGRAVQDHLNIIPHMTALVENHKGELTFYQMRNSRQEEE